MHVQPSKPLVHRHIFDLVVHIEQEFGIFNGAVEVIPILQEVALKLGHVDLEFRELIGEPGLVLRR